MDLSNAFDFIIRQAVVGEPLHIRDLGDFAKTKEYVVKELEELNVEEEAIEHVVNFMEQHGSLLERLGVTPWARRLIAHCHYNNWTSYGEGGQQLAVTKIGSKQGSKLGGDLFNLWYGEAIAEVDDQEEISTEMWMAPRWMAPWTPPSRTPTVEEIKENGTEIRMADQAYADDDTGMVADQMPDRLEVKAVKKVTRWKKAMRKYAFSTNWKKSLALLSLSEGRAHDKRRRTSAAGVMCFSRAIRRRERRSR